MNTVTECQINDLIAEATADIARAKRALAAAEGVVAELSKAKETVAAAKMDTLRYEKNGVDVDAAQAEYNKLEALYNQINDVEYTVGQGMRFFNRNH